MALKGSKTEQNLKEAFAGESQANRRYLYFASKADVEGYNDVAAVFRSTAEGETGHAHGHLEYLEEVGDPATGLPIGGTAENLKAAIAGETHEYTDMYPGMAKAARDEGFDEIADWMETLAKANGGGHDAVWIESPECTACDECIEINPKIFAYNDDKKAIVIDPKGGSYKDIVKAAEKCTAGCIHPGTPWNSAEKDLDKLVKRAAKYQ
jgi:rubrerythrin